MGDVSSAIAAFITDEIKLSMQDIAAASKSREWFLDRIATEISSRSNQPVLYSPEKFVYFGSYFKRTKVAAVDEFDVLVVIDSKGGLFSSGGVVIGTGQGSADPNPKYNGSYHKSDGTGVSPAKMLNWLKGVVDAVVNSFGGEAPERNGQAITAIIKSRNLKIDLVPAGIFSRNTDGTTFYDIPRGDKDNGWIVTSPRYDIDLLNSIAKGKDNFRDIIRLCKYVKNSYHFLVSSFATESAVVQYGSSSYWHNRLDQDFLGVLSFFSTVFRLGTIPDPYDSGNNLISSVESLAWYADRLDTIRQELSNLYQEKDQEVVRKRVRELLMNE